MNHRSLVWLALPALVASCAAPPPPPRFAHPRGHWSPPTAAMPPALPPPAPQPAQSRRFGYQDFANIEGVRIGATLADVETAWGPASHPGDSRLRYADGPSVKTIDPELGRGLLIDFGAWAKPWTAKHPRSPVALLGTRCEDAARSLEFTSSLGGYTTCKHYERDAMIDVTLMCTGGELSTVAVMWVQFDPIPAGQPLPADACSGSGPEKATEGPSCRRACTPGEVADATTGCCKQGPSAEPPIAYTDPAVKVTEVKLSGATFRMGDSGREVTIAPYFLDDIEVTVSAYAACVSAGTCSPPNGEKSCNWGKKERGNHPINCVDWNQAVTYCKASGKRLPSEEEWEWAASNGARETRYPWGNDPAQNQLCWNGAGNDKGKGKRTSTCVVGSHPRGNSGQRIKDLSGNVWEWTSSKYAAEEAHLVIRGSSWLDDLADGNSAFRLRNLPTDRFSNVGFRCARTP